MIACERAVPCMHVTYRGCGGEAHPFATIPIVEYLEVAASFHVKLLDALPSLAADLVSLADWRIWASRLLSRPTKYFGDRRSFTPHEPRHNALSIQKGKLPKHQSGLLLEAH